MFMRNFRLYAPDDETGSGELTVDTAVAALQQQRQEQSKAAEKVETKAEIPEPPKRAPAAEPEADDEHPDATDNDGADEASLSEDEKLKAAVAEEPTTAQGELPSGWSEADRALWAALTPEAQAKLVVREKQREAGIRKQLQATEHAKKEAETQIAEAKAERQKLGPALHSTKQFITQQLVQQFPDVDPRDPNTVLKLALEHPERKVVFDTLIGQLQNTVRLEGEHESRTKAEQDKEFQTFSETRVNRLRELDQSLADAKKAEAFETDVVGFLMKENPYGAIDAERIKHYSAEELLLVRDALKYRKAMAALKPKTPEAPRAVKPGTGQTGTKSDEVAALEKRARKTGTVEDAVALMRARRAG